MREERFVALFGRLDEVLANSYRDFHNKGVDYICLKRSERETIKLYIFDGDCGKLPELVNPHDHRYAFETKCLVGGVANYTFELSPDGQPVQEFAYSTPLNGGAGFSWTRETRLRKTQMGLYRAGEAYWLPHSDIHTIQIIGNETVLLLRQFADCVPLDEPTRTFTLDREPPSLSGLYSRFTADSLRARLKALNERCGVGVVLHEGEYA